MTISIGCVRGGAPREAQNLQQRLAYIRVEAYGFTPMPYGGVLPVLHMAVDILILAAYLSRFCRCMPRSCPPPFQTSVYLSIIAPWT